MDKTPSGPLGIPPFPDFVSAARSTLELLHDRLGFGLWAITRVDGAHQRIAMAVDYRYRVKAGKWYRWLDDYCALALAGELPPIAWNCRELPNFAQLPRYRTAPVLAFVGVPLCRADGGALGLLCAADPLPQTDDLLAEQSLLELLAQLLSTLFAMEQRIPTPQ